MIRAYMPVDADALDALSREGAVRAAHVVSVTPGVRALAPDGDEELHEHLACQLAAAAATSDPVVVVAFDVRPERVEEAAGHVGAISLLGDVALRVRDTGHGLNDNEVAAATEPFRTPAPSDRASESAGVSLSLTKALVEANRAQFHIRTGSHSGTLIEVVFAQAKAQASE